MRRRPLFILMFLAALFLASCQTNPGQSADNGITQTPITLPTNSPAPTAMETEAASADSAAPAGCSLTSFQPTPEAAEDALFPPPTDKDWSKGPADAYVTFIEYADFMCPGCSGLAPVLKEIVAEYPQDLRFVYRHFPLESIHDKAALAAQAAQAAGEQGKFWEMHDLLFEKQDEWSSMDEKEFQKWLEEQAGKLDLDVKRFLKDVTSEENVKFVQTTWEQGQAAGLMGTPSLVFNGELYNGPISYGNIKEIIDTIMLEKKQFNACPPMTIDSKKKYTATLKTEKGDIVIQLYPDKAPLAVNNFVFLARQGWYDGVTFHRVLAGFMAQTGDPTGTGMGGPGYAFDNEIAPDLKFDGPGVVGMANSGPDTNGSQFFITFAATPHLDGGYTIFGRVIKGMDVVQSITLRDPSRSRSLPPGDKILSVTIQEE